jgi:hypothetical protein
MLPFKMHRNSTYWIWVIVLICFSSCIEQVSVNLPPYNEKVVVNGLISDSDLTKIRVSKSISSLDTNFIPSISLASVRLFEENGALYDVLSYNSFEGGFIGTKVAKKNVDYTIKVNYQGTALEGTTRITGGTQVYNLNFVDSVAVDSSLFPIGEVSFTFNDLPGQDNFYRLNVEYFDNIKKEFQALDMSENLFLDAKGELTDKGYIFDDNSFRGKPQTISVRVPFGFVDVQNGDYLFRVNLEALNSDYTSYEKSRRLYDESFGGFFTEPVELYSNIKRGLGIFGGVAVSRDTL